MCRAMRNVRFGCPCVDLDEITRVVPPPSRRHPPTGESRRVRPVPRSVDRSLSMRWHDSASYRPPKAQRPSVRTITFRRRAADTGTTCHAISVAVGVHCIVDISIRLWAGSARSIVKSHSIGFAQGKSAHRSPHVDRSNPPLSRGPIAVDECVRRVHRVSAEQAMPLRQDAGERLELRTQVGRRVVPVVQMHLHFAETRFAQCCECVELLGPIGLGGEEEAVLGRAAVRIPELTGEHRVLAQPFVHALLLAFDRDSAVVWLEVIDQTEEHVQRSQAFDAVPARANPRPQVTGQPDLCVLRQANDHGAIPAAVRIARIIE